MAKKRKSGKKRKVTAYSKCLGREMKGRKFPNKGAVQRAFKIAVKKCKRKKKR